MTIKLGESEKRVRLNVLGKIEDVGSGSEKVDDVQADVAEDVAVSASEEPESVAEPEKKQPRRGRRRK